MVHLAGYTESTKGGRKNGFIDAFIFTLGAFGRTFENDKITCNTERRNKMRTITVKGIGKAKVRPDFVVISLDLESKDKNYELAMMDAAEKIEEIKKSLLPLGFEKEDIKTTDFRVDTDYESKKDHYGNYYREFCGYEVSHRLKISFDFDTKRLSKVLGVIAGLICQPELSVHFTVKDSGAVNDALLQSATENARQKAQVLAMASGVKLGEIKMIDYNWGEVSFYSRTRYDLNDCCMAMSAQDSAPGLEIEPDDIDASDTATFVWEIV